MKDTFSLQEIANWQLNTNESLVQLPSVQRGFVWKPKQIEDLWDSILRGYPIGSFLLSHSGDKFDLMDGQQRATSIFLGYFNPFNKSDETAAWSIKGQLPVVWVDIKPNAKPTDSKYLIRVVTRSHPWGYKAANNNEKLSVPDRRAALNKFKLNSENTGNYTLFKNTTVFPFDCLFPLPLSFLIESKAVDEVIDRAEQFLPDYISKRRTSCPYPYENKEAFIQLLRNDLNADLKEIFKTVKELESMTIKANIIDNKVLEEENQAENPVLFVRINSAGTTLSGDDLIYSIYKAIFPEAKDLIENIGLKFIAPTQVLSLVSRIVASDLSNHTFPRKMNVRDFQNRIKNNDFKENLKLLIENGHFAKLFEQAINILSCKENDMFEGEIPPVIIKQIIRKNQDVFLFFVYWLHIHNEQFTEQTKFRMAAKIITFAWFDFGNLPRLWNEKINVDNFWNESLNDLMWWIDDKGNDENGIQFLIKPELLKEYYAQPIIEKMFAENNKDRWGLWQEGVGNNIIEYYNHVKSNQFELQTANNYFWRFIQKIQHNKQLILFAQRDYINATFGEYNQMDDVEDTNVPWDWDHIYPSEWVYRKVYCNPGIKDWNNTNGNFRAISLEHNRSRSNQQAPKDITGLGEQQYSLIKENDWFYWKNINDRIWNNEIENHFRAVTTRMINIYEKYWNDLRINELITN